ncbi:HlyD family type I secretion periplasmic adaptor subunit [Martelella sp. HB161492]|uniref:HlyD family type I secretion periplasmic adaptor subunit n=1 Tax=Martelella sp. HB161492 TaxID=2720726 RepID=UPI00159161D8|nr:HlyD family type I secretion periplasmic adaptor subunit [Martelella sp. HB161492]
MSDKWSSRRILRFGFLALALAAGGIVVWGFSTEIGGAVIASGQVEVQARRQVIQHPDGGVVAEIDVHDGEKVKAGQQLILLDDTMLSGQRQILRRQIFEAEASLARAQAQVLSQETLTFSSDLQAEADADPDLQSVLDGEQKLFAVTAESNDLLKQQLARQQEQADAMIAASEEEVAALRRALDVAHEELERYQGLLDRGLTPANVVSSLKQQSASLEAQIADLKVTIAETEGNLASDKVQLLRVTSDARKSAQSEVAQIRPQLAELKEHLAVINTEYGRLSLRAPMDGTVYDMKMFTVGGVIQPGAEVAAIAAADEPFVLAVKVSPASIDRVHVGQDVILKFPNFDSRTTPEFSGTVRMISADTLVEEKSGSTYFRVEIALDPASLTTARTLGLMPGMPVQAFVQTGVRSPVTYLLKPLTDYFDLAFREE